MCTLSIDDDGAGIAKNGDEVTGIGMRVMDYHANLIGGMLTIKSSPGKGGKVS